MLLNMDCFGLRRASSHTTKSRQHYLTADINRALHIHQTSLNLSNNSYLFGGSQGKFLAVAEGVGDAEMASRASTLAIDCVSKTLINEHGVAIASESAECDIGNRLVQLVEASQEAMIREGEVLETHRGMAARLGVGYVLWPNLYLVQVGTTRCLLLRNGWLTEWSSTLSDFDDQFVGGPDSGINPCVRRVPLRLGDRLLLSSGSVAEAVSDFELKRLMSLSDSASKICESLAATAVENGCSDCSLIVACFDEGSPGLPPSEARSEPVSAEVNQSSAAGNYDPAIGEKTGDVTLRSAQRPAVHPLAESYE